MVHSGRPVPAAVRMVIVLGYSLVGVMFRDVHILMSGCWSTAHPAVHQPGHLLVSSVLVRAVHQKAIGSWCLASSTKLDLVKQRPCGRFHKGNETGNIRRVFIVLPAGCALFLVFSSKPRLVWLASASSELLHRWPLASSKALVVSSSTGLGGSLHFQGCGQT